MASIAAESWHLQEGFLGKWGRQLFLGLPRRSTVPTLLQTSKQEARRRTINMPSTGFSGTETHRVRFGVGFSLDSKAGLGFARSICSVLV